MKNALTPKRIINVEGKIAYAESFQAWNVIRLKKELVDEFPQLKEKRSSFSYKIVFCRDFKEITSHINKLKNDSVMPMLMWLYKES